MLPVPLQILLLRCALYKYKWIYILFFFFPVDEANTVVRRPDVT